MFSTVKKQVQKNLKEMSKNDNQIERIEALIIEKKDKELGEKSLEELQSLRDSLKS